MIFKAQTMIANFEITREDAIMPMGGRRRGPGGFWRGPGRFGRGPRGFGPPPPGRGYWGWRRPRGCLGCCLYLFAFLAAIGAIIAALVFLL